MNNLFLWSCGLISDLIHDHNTLTLKLRAISYSYLLPITEPPAVNFSHSLVRMVLYPLLVLCRPGILSLTSFDSSLVTTVEEGSLERKKLISWRYVLNEHNEFSSGGSLIDWLIDRATCAHNQSVGARMLTRLLRIKHSLSLMTGNESFHHFLKIHLKFLLDANSNCCMFSFVKIIILKL